MCRYADHNYKKHFTCFECRKMFKYYRGLGCRGVQKCPQCGKPMVDLGLDFKPPKQNNINQWRKVEILYTHGITFHSCGCHGPGHRPKNLADLPKAWRK